MSEEEEQLSVELEPEQELDPELELELELELEEQDLEPESEQLASRTPQRIGVLPQSKSSHIYRGQNCCGGVCAGRDFCG